MENLSQFLCESWTFCFQLCIHSLWEISDVPRECWYIVHFTLNYPWAVYPGCRLTKSWMQDNGAGSLHSWLVLAWINSGAVEAFHQLSCDTAPPPPNNSCKPDLATCRLGVVVSYSYCLLWSASSCLSGLGQIWLLSSCSEMILPDQRWFCKSYSLRFWEGLSEWTQ